MCGTFSKVFAISSECIWSRALGKRLESSCYIYLFGCFVYLFVFSELNLQCAALYLQMLEEFQAAFVAVVFNHELVLRQQSVVPFMFLLPRSA